MYLDTSAIAKLAVDEPESRALRVALGGVRSLCTSIVGRIEFERVVRRHVEDADVLMASVLAGIEILPLHVASAAIAAAVTPASLRTLDAIHLATVLEVRADVDAFYCYDHDLARAARAHGITVLAPGHQSGESRHR